MTEYGKKVALVTGGGRGIGREICIALAKEGITVVTCYAKNETAAKETITKCKEYTQDAIAIKADIRNEKEIEALFGAIKEQYGRLDILVNNAGVTRDDLVIKMTHESFLEVIDTNLTGAFLCTKQAAKQMITQRYGRIISISSVVGLTGNAGQANYAASKAGLIGFSKSVAKELGKRNITVNVVAPGFIETDMTKNLPENLKKEYEQGIALKRFGNAKDVADTVCFLASDKASYLTGNVICVDGGMAM